MEPKTDFNYNDEDGVWVMEIKKKIKSKAGSLGVGHFYTSKEFASQIDDNFFLGDSEDACNNAKMEEHKITHVVNVVHEWVNTGTLTIKFCGNKIETIFFLLNKRKYILRGSLERLPRLSE